jgi:hypothetical protein
MSRPRELEGAIERIASSARQNAGETEGVTSRDSAEWDEAYRSSVQVIVEGCTGRECSGFGLSRPLTSAQALRVKRRLIGGAS